MVGAATSCLGKLETISDEGFKVERNNKYNIEQKIKKSTGLPGFSQRCGKRDKSQGPPLPVKNKESHINPPGLSPKSFPQTKLFKNTRSGNKRRGRGEPMDHLGHMVENPLCWTASE